MPLRDQHSTDPLHEGVNGASVGLGKAGKFGGMTLAFGFHVGAYSGHPCGVLSLHPVGLFTQ